VLHQSAFKKNDIPWPLQPLTEKVLKLNKIFHDPTQSYIFDPTQKNFFTKHKNKAEFKCLDDSEVLSRDFPGLKTSVASMTSVASTASMASMTSTASFLQNKLMILMV
jgi:hypothetical protein